jgi:lipopolysaccharide transport protein LptA
MNNRLSVYGLGAMALVLFVLYGAAVSLTAEPVYAEEASQKTEIEADRLETNSAAKYAEFIGNVKASQGQHRLSSDKLRIYYKGNVNSLSQGGPPGGDDLEIKKIVAYGNVHIVSDEYTVDTSRAEYEVDTQIMTLTGANSKVTQGKNTLIGSKITLYQAEGRVQVDGESGKRVKVIFFPEGNEADFLKGPKQPPRQ